MSAMRRRYRCCIPAKMHVQNALQAEQPFDLLRVDGRSCKLFRNAEQRQAVENMEGMLPWNGKEDNLIDRFDGRALLDFYRLGRNARNCYAVPATAQC